MILVKKIESKKDLKTFINLPWDIYKNDELWVPPLKLAVEDLLSEKHPFLETASRELYLAYKNDQAVGRIAVIHNQTYNQFHQESAIHFGLYESIDNQEVCQALFAKVYEIGKKYKLKKMLGPFNLSTNYECGLLIEGPKDPPQIMMTYNPPYYQTLFEAYGLQKTKDLLAYDLDLNFEMPEKIQYIASRLEKKEKVTFRPISLKDWDKEIELLFNVYNDAWEKNWGFVPMTRAEFFHSAKDLKMVLDKNLVLFVESQGETAGLIVALPDFNQVLKKVKKGTLFPFGIFQILLNKKKINRARVITLGLKQKFRKSGLETLLYTKTQKLLLAAGYKKAELSWILEDNFNMNRPLLLMGAIPYKRYRIFEKII